MRISNISEADRIFWRTSAADTRRLQQAGIRHQGEFVIAFFDQDGDIEYYKVCNFPSQAKHPPAGLTGVELVAR